MENREKDSKIGNPNASSKPTGNTNTKTSSKSGDSANFDQKKDRPETVSAGRSGSSSPNQGDQGRTSGSAGYEADKNKSSSRDSQSNDKKTGNKSQSSPSGQQGQNKNTGSKL
jgi:hypothetical protein